MVFKAAPEGSQISSHNQYSMQPQSTLPRSDSQYDHETTVDGQTLLNVNQGIETQDPVVQASSEDGQVEHLTSIACSYLHFSPVLYA